MRPRLCRDRGAAGLRGDWCGSRSIIGRDLTTEMLRQYAGIESVVHLAMLEDGELRQLGV